MELEWRQTVKEKAAKVPVKQVSRVSAGLFFKVCRYLLLLGVSYLMLYPVLNNIVYTFSNPYDLLDGNVVWIPRNPTFMNIVNVLDYFKYVDHLKVTLSASVISTGLSLIVCPMIGYGLARYRFKGNGLVFALVILTIIVPVQTAQVPLYLEYQAFDFFGIGTLIGKITGKPLTVNLLNTNWVYWLPAMFGVGLRSGVYIFLFRQYFKGMPKDLEDAGKVDGCTRFGVYLRLILPNVKPVFVTVFLLSMIFYWNDTVISGMLITSTDELPLATYVDMLINLGGGAYTTGLRHELETMAEGRAAMLLVVAPLMILFIVCQKFFVESMDRSGIKG
ncbi:MAG: carbohydrate ABC transporter permease [Lachnospiraceae bacterium]|nr:carbohydrate ABC transporter permease [Lachnospiraceae bacterium]